jgi:hypothetical protein
MHKAIKPPPACAKQQDTNTQNSEAVRPTMTGKKSPSDTDASRKPRQRVEFFEWKIVSVRNKIKTLTSSD